MLVYKINKTAPVPFKEIKIGELFQLVHHELGECKKLDKETLKFWDYEGSQLTAMMATITPETECYLYDSSII